MAVGYGSNNKFMGKTDSRATEEANSLSQWAYGPPEQLLLIG